MSDRVSETEGFLDHLSDLFSAHHAVSDLGGRLSSSAHMLQTAAAAEAAEAPPGLVAAALLHDIGHWLREHSDAVNDSDNAHERIGSDYLARYFGTDVTQPIALHVAAKRYLCAREPDYFAKLSPGSVRSLERQGGPMTEAQAVAFESDPAHVDAVALRRWDEYGKAPDLAVAGFDHYRTLLLGLMHAKSES